MAVCVAEWAVAYGASAVSLLFVTAFVGVWMGLVLSPILVIPLLFVPVGCRYEGGRLYVRFPLRVESVEAEAVGEGEEPRGVLCLSGWRFVSKYAHCRYRGEEVLLVRTCGCGRWMKLRGRVTVYACCG